MMHIIRMALLAAIVPFAAAAAQDPPDPPADAPPGPSWWPAIVKSDGSVDRTAYLREARAADRASLHRRFGPDFEHYHKGKAEPVPTVWKPPDKFSPLRARGAAGYTYQIGDRKAADTDGNAETSGQVLYAADKTDDPGVDRINTWVYQRDVQGNFSFMLKPEPTAHGGTHPEPGLLQQSWKQAGGGVFQGPVAVGRANSGFKVCGLVAFSSGLIGATGTVTSGYAYPCLQLPKSKVPTGVAITNSNEFALVTIWDTQAFAGQVAVIALESSATKGGGNPQEQWRKPHPGLWSWGILTGMKLLGFVDLPGMAAPTDLSVSGNRRSVENSLNGKFTKLGAVDLSQQSVRDSFIKGENKEQPSSAGFAVVTSKYDRKAAFIDLEPLFQYYREMYFTTAENFGKTLTQGPGPKEWPYAFEAEPRCKPRVISTLRLPGVPTAVHTSPFGGREKARAFIATVEGKLLIYAVGGLADETPASPAEIGCVGIVPVGRNPCSIAGVKADWEVRPAELIVACRGDREICFVALDGAMGAGKVTKRLKDSRLLDPVHLENTETAFVVTPMVTVCDFRGRKVVNYRYGPILPNIGPKIPIGMGPDGKAEFECGGWMDFPGFPFRVSSVNVP